MDSGNSGSFQSSSGGDEEFDSTGGGGVDSSPLLRPAPSSSAAAFSFYGSPYYGLRDFATAAPPQRQQQQPPPRRAGIWSGAPEPFAGASGGAADRGARWQAGTSAAARGSALAPAPPRGSRKRARAWRRAPTTVMTTDTTNFRAMVQEFTGVPSPPFAAGGVGVFPPPSSLPPYLLRPFAHKLPSAPSAFPPLFTSTSSASSTLSSAISVANANAATGPATTAAASSNPTVCGAADTFQLSSSALLRLQDPGTYLSFQNLLDSHQLHEHGPSPSSEFLAGSGSGSLGLAHGGLVVLGSEGLHLHPRSDDAQHGDNELSGVVASGGGCKLNYSTHATSSSAAAGTARSARGEGQDPWICTSDRVGNPGKRARHAASSSFHEPVLRRR